DGAVGNVGLEQLDHRFPRDEAGNARAVRVVERMFGEAEHVLIEGNTFVDRAYGNADMRDRDRSAGRFLHASLSYQHPVTSYQRFRKCRTSSQSPTRASNRKSKNRTGSPLWTFGRPGAVRAA